MDQRAKPAYDSAKIAAGRDFTSAKTEP